MNISKRVCTISALILSKHEGMSESEKFGLELKINRNIDALQKEEQIDLFYLMENFSDQYLAKLFKVSENAIEFIAKGLNISSSRHLKEVKIRLLSNQTIPSRANRLVKRK
jgi:hypothetical protein